jgi:DNA-binding CsgD family transcriptional regulator
VIALLCECSRSAVSAVTELVDREEERARIAQLLDEAAKGSARLLLEGEAGIGKTSIWRAGIAAAEQRGYRVLAARPCEAEQELSFAALGDLLGGVTDEIDRLPELQRRSLRVALLLAPLEGEPPGQRMLGVAVLTLLSLLAESGPVIVAIDDLQWLDRPTAGVLEFALRRVSGEKTGVLGARRSGHKAALQLEDAELLSVRPLSLSAIDRLLRTHLGAQFLRPTLLQIERTSGGNPFYALELARALLARPEPFDPNEPLPVPENLRQLLRARLGRLSQNTRTALVAAAVLARPREEVVSATVQANGWLNEALDAGAIEQDGALLRFTHPLLPAVLHSDAPAGLLRHLHRRLAETVDDLEQRARHLAAAAQGEDAAAAAALEEAGARAIRRGAADAAAELTALSLRLTPASCPEDAHRRLVAAARYNRIAGNYRQARELLEPAFGAARTGNERAELLVEFAWTISVVDERASERALENALEALGDDDDRLCAQIHLERALFDVGHNRTDRRHLDVACALAERLGDPRLSAAALAVSALHEMNYARDPGTELIQEAIVLQTQTGEIWPFDPQYASALRLMLLDRLEEARLELETYLHRATDAGVWWARQLALAQLWQVEAMVGNWDDAARWLRAFQEGAAQVGDETDEACGLRMEAFLQLQLGCLEDARERAERGRDLAERAGAQPYVRGCDLLLGAVALAADEIDEAHRRFRACLAGSEIPNLDALVEDAEALVRLGQLDEASQLLEAAERRVLTTRPSYRASLKRCRGSLAAARGENDRALALLAQAVEELEAFPRPVELGRALLALGSTARRQRKNRLARESLQRARALFEDLGMPLWAERARVELARVGGRTASPGKLTETERRIAELVASGRSNAQVAHTLYVSPKTVEWNLSKIYRKLHVTSRTELAAKLARSHN